MRPVLARAQRSLILVCTFACVMKISAQQGTIAFWEPTVARADSLLLHDPGNDADRYAQLRQAFAEFRCSSERMPELSVGKHDGKNLVCVLPGQDTEQIVVAARYERRGRKNAEDSGWAASVTLPMLYHALQAQSRRHTFLFAALGGAAGEKDFFRRIGDGRLMKPRALVVLDRLAAGEPRFYTVAQVPDHYRPPQTQAIVNSLEADADFTAALQGIKRPRSGYTGWIDDDETMLFRLERTASILLYSAAGPGISAEAFHKNLDFIVYFLCKTEVDDEVHEAPARF